jgi:hypothetical protein
MSDSKREPKDTVERLMRQGTTPAEDKEEQRAKEK